MIGDEQVLPRLEVNHVVTLGGAKKRDADAPMGTLQECAVAVGPDKGLVLNVNSEARLLPAGTHQTAAADGGTYVETPLSA